MRKLLLSGENDIWYFKTTSTDMMFYVLINSNSIKNVSSFDIVIDKDSNPHVVLEKKGKILYYYWSGRGWKKGPQPALNDYSKFYVTLSEEIGIVLAISREFSGETEIVLLTLQQNRWLEIGRGIIPHPIKVKAIYYNDNKCFIIYTRDEVIRSTVGIANYASDKWNIIYELDISKGKLLNWAVNDGKIYLLIGQVTGTDCVFKMCCYNKGSFHNYNFGRIDGWEGTPGIYISEKNHMKILWNYLNYIYLADVDSKEQEFKRIIKSDIFFPSELMVLTNSHNLGQRVAFSSIFGTKLAFPLVLSWEALELMIRGKQVSSRNIYPRSIVRKSLSSTKQDGDNGR